MHYLEALELLLQNQASWLIGEQGLRPELKTVIMDLWNLRLRGFPRDDTVPGAMFSSQSSPAPGQLPSTSRSRAQSWDSDRGAAWSLPKLPDTLALCYLATILLRIPTRQGQILDWVNSGNMPYQKAVSN